MLNIFKQFTEEKKTTVTVQVTGRFGTTELSDKIICSCTADFDSIFRSANNFVDMSSKENLPCQIKITMKGKIKGVEINETFDNLIGYYSLLKKHELTKLILPTSMCLGMRN